MSAPTVTGPVLRQRYVVHGVVQGVGFRPHVARLATSLGLAGTCCNDATSVLIEVEGPAALIDEFGRRLTKDAPPLARVHDVITIGLPLGGGMGFSITSSTGTVGARTLVPPDTAVCEECLAELADPTDRRYRHPFITCTNCGPRFTIIEDLPYDRRSTTMAGFPMCRACSSEYADPADRRHHAQPIACHDCGPTLRVTDRNGTVLASGTEPSLAAAAAALWGGAIVAIKGIGGYHLACDASSCTATSVLRGRKHRPDQPFAVMAADLAAAATIVEIGGAGELLVSSERPILLLPRRKGAPVADCVAPGLDELGVVLPYAPLHHLLFAPRPDGSPGAPSLLVMTSGNVSGEPLCFDDDDATDRLGEIADLFLAHNRPIAVPCEDSVLAWNDGDVVPLRRSRGFAPLPVAVGGGTGVVLASGAEVKNTVALSRDGMAFVSAHIGDLDSLASRQAQSRTAAQLIRFHRRTPDLVVADLHPGYASRVWAKEVASGLGVPLYDVQHHHAHLAALAVEHGRLGDPVLGVVFDGTGYGCDASLWGGEFLLLGDGGLSATRVGRLGTVRLPGGDAGVRNPVRTAALAMLRAGADLEGTPVEMELTDPERAFLGRLAVTDEGSVATSSAGRLFDVVAAILGIRGRVTYEAQAAIELEVAARRFRSTHGPHAIRFDLPVLGGPVPQLDVDPLVRGLTKAVSSGAPADALAWAFHVALARAAGDLAIAMADAHCLRTIGLTGGVFANRILLGLMRERLVRDGFEVLTHRLVPANDGGLALGQVAVGARSLKASVDERS
jgi:hydrogenase maturation protein HypF